MGSNRPHISSLSSKTADQIEIGLIGCCFTRDEVGGGPILAKVIGWLFSHSDQFYITGTKEMTPLIDEDIHTPVKKW